MKHSLYLKFILGYVLFGVIGFLTIATFSKQMTYRFLVRQNAQKLYDEATLMAYTYQSDDYITTDITKSLSPQLTLMGNYLNSHIWIVDKTGRIVADSDRGKYTGVVITDFDPAAGSGNSITGYYYGLFSTEMLSVNAPINYNYNPVGYVVIHQPLSEVLRSTNEILNIVYTTSSVIFGLSLIILILFTFIVYLPLRKITAAANEYAKGNLEYKVSVHSDDEMGYLAETMNYMAGELNNMESYQRDFIANVSHDFRSPLTSIKGFSEAMLDGTIPPELYSKYLTRIISESERLNKLTYSMLSLNVFDAKNLLKRSNFDINRTIKDICNSYETACLKRELTFDLTFEDEVEMVYADYGKIQQVLYNLVDNAVKFSYTGTAIRIATSVRQKKVYISVKDNGIGIPKASIKKIWDRFYKTDLSRGRDKNGTGLGLSIVREILQAHGETIDVVSTEKIGTEFIFSLPRAVTDEL